MPPMLYLLHLFGVLALSTASSLTLQLVKNTTCLDGSLAGYYYSPPPTAQSQTWVIYLEGGGACFTEASCTKRSKGDLGSSKNWQKTMNCKSQFLLCDEESANPGFNNAHHVYVPYANGDTHRGMRTQASEETWGLYFSGHLNLRTIFNHLEQSYGLLSNSSHILLTGSSAGGIGTLYNVDYLKSIVASENTVVKAAPNAGFFFPGALKSDFPGHPEYPPSNFSCFSQGQHCGFSNFESLVADLWQSYRHPKCVAAHSEETVWYCDSAMTQYAYVESPVYLLENQYDTNQIMTQNGCPKPTPSSPMSSVINAYISMYGEAMRNSTEPQVQAKADQDALFLPSCFQHGVSTTITIGGTQQLTWPEILPDWYWEHGKLTDSYFLVDDCKSPDGLPCNAMAGCQIATGSNSCRAQLEKDGCLSGEKVLERYLLQGPAKAASACIECAQSHRKDLESAGCTVSEVQSLCTSENA